MSYPEVTMNRSKRDRYDDSPRGDDVDEVESLSDGMASNRSCSSVSDAPTDYDEEERAQAEMREIQSGANTSLVEKRPEEETPVVQGCTAFLTLTRDNNQSPSSWLKLTPYLVYQIFRAECVPKKIMVLAKRQERSTSDWSEIHSAELQTTPVRHEKAIVQFESDAVMENIVEKMNNITVELVNTPKPNHHGQRLQVRESFHLSLCPSSEGKVFAHKNTDRVLVMTPQCAHLLGPIMHREWGDGVAAKKTAPPPLQPQLFNSTPLVSSMPQDMMPQQNVLRPQPFLQHSLTPLQMQQYSHLLQQQQLQLQLLQQQHQQPAEQSPLPSSGYVAPQ